MRQLEFTQVLLCRSVFPESKPYGVLDMEAPRKLPAPTWEKGKGSEVSVMLTVSAAAAKVCPGDASRARRRCRSEGSRRSFPE